ncbi:MAG: DUF2283 domain-containing protein [Balneolaceae bacterium]|nr:MAG: DUF2283 domain-containing protein [Balneolaceae bacterium]
MPTRRGNTAVLRCFRPAWSFCLNENDEQRPGIIFDYDAEGNIVGIEIPEASKKTEKNI